MLSPNWFNFSQMSTSGKKLSSKLEKEEMKKRKEERKKEELQKWRSFKDDVQSKGIERERPAGILPFSKQVTQHLWDWHLMVKFLQGTQALVFFIAPRHKTVFQSKWIGLPVLFAFLSKLHNNKTLCYWDIKCYKRDYWRPLRACSTPRLVIISLCFTLYSSFPGLRACGWELTRMS